MQAEHPIILPNLPSMFFRSLFTVARKDLEPAEASQLVAEFSAPSFSQEQVARYHQAFGGFVSDIPLTLLYCLAQRVHLAQMLGEHFPWPAPGLVHVSNSLLQHQAIAPQQGFHLKACIQLPRRGPGVSARRLRPVFEVEFWQNEEKVATCVSEYQVMPKSSERPPRKPKEASKTAESPDESWQRLSYWQLNDKAGRNYARLSGDFNPIHLHPLVSRWFGFNQPIIHGMYMAARAQAEIERLQQRAISEIEVSFKRPVPLPAKISLWQQSNPDQPDHGHYQICGAEDQLQRLTGRYQLADD